MVMVHYLGPSVTAVIKTINLPLNTNTLLLVDERAQCDKTLTYRGALLFSRSDYRKKSIANIFLNIVY